MAKINFSGKKKLLSKIGKKNLIILAAVLIIGLAVYLNYTFFYDNSSALPETDEPVTEGTEQVETTVSSDNYFTATQLSRQRARDEALEVLQTVIDSESALEETKAEALAEMTRIASEIEKESRIEALITAKGFEQCIAVINEDKISVVVKSDFDLQQNHLAQINEIVMAESGIIPQNVKIIKK